MISSVATKPVVSARTARAFGATAPRPLRVQRFSACAAADKAQVLTSVREIIADQLGADMETVAPESKFVDLGADSLDTVEIMMALEEKFDIQVEEEGAEKISTVQEAADMIAAQISK